MTDESPLDGVYTAVLDRFEEDVAVLLVEAEGEIVDERHLDRGELPEAGRHQDAIFELEIDSGSLVELRYDSKATEERKANAQRRFDRLSRRLSENDDTDG